VLLILPADRRGMIMWSHSVAALLAALVFIAQPVEASPLVAGADLTDADRDTYGNSDSDTYAHADTRAGCNSATFYWWNWTGIPQQAAAELESPGTFRFRGLKW
jgi:hypothetical protein